MKFITEDDLRDLYKVTPFTTYDLASDERLTPGARQFLLDRGIDMYSKDTSGTNNGGSKGTTPGKGTGNESQTKKQIELKRLASRLNSIHALFLTTSGDLVNKDACMTQNLLCLSQQLNCIKKMTEGKGLADNLSCRECTGIKQDNFSDDLGECFEINDFHLQLEKGRELLLLHRLRCELQELEPLVQELGETGEKEKELCEDLNSKVNQLVNSLSQMICTAFGGEKCQRQN